MLNTLRNVLAQVVETQNDILGLGTLAHSRSMSENEVKKARGELSNRELTALCFMGDQQDSVLRSALKTVVSAHVAEAAKNLQIKQDNLTKIDESIGQRRKELQAFKRRLDIAVRTGVDL